MNNKEKFRCGLLWGMSLSQQDMDKYCLYFFLASIQYIDCDFLKYYSWFFFISEFGTLIFQVIH